MKALFLILAIVTLAVGLTSALIALRAPISRRWLWALICVIGGPGLSLNMSSGELLNRVSFLQPFNVGFVRSAEVAAPWILTVAFPLGAVVFHIRRKALGRSASESGGTPADAA